MFTREFSWTSSFVYCLLILAGFPTLARGQEFVHGEVLLAFHPGVAPAHVEAVRQGLAATQIEQFPPIGVHHWRLPPGLTVEWAVTVLSVNPNVKYAEPNYVVRAADVPNDARFDELWDMHNVGQTGGTPDADIDAPEAWDIQTGSSSVVVAVIDTGVDYAHEDLALNMWINNGEIPADIHAQLVDIDGDGTITYYDLNDPANQGPNTITDLNGNGMIDGGDLYYLSTEGGWYDDLDTDANGIVDDLLGAGYGHDPSDWNGHGTHVAGIIGAVGNNGVGVAGVNHRVTIMPCKFLGSTGFGTTANAIFFINYAASFMDGSGNRIVRVMNASWGGGGYSQALKDAIAASGAMFVAGAGNSGKKINRYFYPATYDLANIVSVAATDHNDLLASFSSWHAEWVDLGAPGADVLSTIPTYDTLYNRVSGAYFQLSIWDPSGYGSLSGTSMATPHVAGVAALVMAQNPTLDILAVKDRILSSADPLSSLAGKTLTGGRLNALGALTGAPPPPPPPPPGGITVSSVIPNSMSAGTMIAVTVGGSGFQPGATVTFENGTGGTPSADVTFVSIDGTTIDATVTAPGGGPRGARVWDLRVTNPDASSGVLMDGFTVIR